MPRVATYVRVSTRSQDVEPQRRRLAELLAARGWDHAAEYEDVASGRRARRPGLQRLRRDARRGAFDAVLCVRLDRIARSTRHLCEVAEELEAAGVDLVAADQHFDTSSPSGKLLFGVLAVVAQFEADLLTERTRDGLQLARARGRRLGRPPVLDARAVARARRLRDSGKSLRAIADTLGCSRTSVHRALRA